MKFLKMTIIFILSLLVISSCSDEPITGWQKIKLKTSPSKRYDSCSFYQKSTNSFYIIGGRDSDNHNFNDIWKFDLSKENWTKKPTPSGVSLDNAGRMNYCIFDNNNNVVYLYGMNGSGNALPSQILKYDVNNNKLKEIAPSSLPDTSLRGHSIILLESGLSEPSLVIFGGENPGNNKNNDIRIFGLVSKTFKTLNVEGVKPTPRMLHVAVLSANNEMIIIGGKSDSGSLKDIWSFNFTSKKWTKIDNNFQINGYYASSFYYKNDNSIYFYGGKDNNGKFTSDFIKYDITNNSWTILDKSNKPGPLSGSSIMYNDNKFYLFAGNSLTTETISSNNTWKYIF